MEIEYEATFTNIDKAKMRTRLTKSGAILIKPEFLQRRAVFHLPKGHEITGGWLRVRDEGDKITMSLKVVDGNKVQDQKETCLQVSDFNEAINFLQSIGCQQKSFQETKRELWRLNEVDITIDEWPFLEPFIEIEGSSENDIKIISQKLGFDYSQAIFGAVDVLYSKKYNISPDIINNQTPEIIFGDSNPFLNK
jgi:adenylate cyclase class 2